MPYIQLEHFDSLSLNPTHVINSVSIITTKVVDIMSPMADVAHRTMSSMSILTPNISWHFAILILLPLSAFIVRAIYQAYGTGLRDIPGPWQAKFTRLWLLRAISSRSFQKINLDLHRRYGMSVSLFSIIFFVFDQLRDYLFMSKPRYRPYRPHWPKRIQHRRPAECQSNLQIRKPAADEGQYLRLKPVRMTKC